MASAIFSPGRLLAVAKSRAFFQGDMIFPELDPTEPAGLDFETSGLKYWLPEFSVFGIGVAQGDQQWYWDIRQHPGAVEWLKDQNKKRISWKAHAAQFEYQCSRRLGLDPRSMDLTCTMTSECLIDEHYFQYNLDECASINGIRSEKYEHLERIRVAMGWGDRAEVLRRLSEAPADLVSQYGSDDARLTLELWRSQVPRLDSQELWRVYELEKQLLPVLADMSYVGVRVDLEAAHAAIPKLDEAEEKLAREIKEEVGCKDSATFVNSPKQMREFFKPEPISKWQWKTIDGTIVGATKGGKGPSLGQDALRDMQHPVATKILALRKTIKLRDTFIRGHIIGSADGMGYVHTNFNQTRNDSDAGTVTGRLSSTDPALQQITKRDKENAALLRAMFLPDEFQDWGCFDYSQVDFRCAAHLQNVPTVIQAYRENPKLDYHQIVSDMTGIPRNAPYAGAPYTKQINLGLTFGAGEGKMAFMMKMPVTVREGRNGRVEYVPGPEAKAIFSTYHSMLPGTKRFMQHARNVAKEYGYVKTQLGRRLRFIHRDWHKAAGLLYQSYAADLHKVGLVEVDHTIRNEGLPARLMMSCHDEIGVSAVEDPAVRDKIQRVYTDFNSENSRIKMRVPIDSSAKFGANWWMASKDD